MKEGQARAQPEVASDFDPQEQAQGSAEAHSAVREALVAQRRRVASTVRDRSPRGTTPAASSCNRIASAGADVARRVRPLTTKSPVVSTGTLHALMKRRFL